MKIRNGFVSNSSSSSFCILGVMVDNADKYYDVLKGTSLTTVNGIEEYYERKFIGMRPEDILEDKTIKETKEYIKSELKKIGIEDADISWYTDGGIDG